MKSADKYTGLIVAILRYRRGKAKYSAYIYLLEYYDYVFSPDVSGVYHHFYAKTVE